MRTAGAAACRRRRGSKYASACVVANQRRPPWSAYTVPTSVPARPSLVVYSALIAAEAPRVDAPSMRTTPRLLVAYMSPNASSAMRPMIAPRNRAGVMTTNRRERLAMEVVDAKQPGKASRTPEASPTIEARRSDPAGRQTIGRGQQPKPLAVEARDAAVPERDPQAAIAILGERRCCIERAQSVGVGVAPKAVGPAVPSRQDLAPRIQAAGPDVPARILEQTAEAVFGKPVTRRVDARYARSEIVDVPDVREAEQTGARREPPVASAVLDHRLVAAPAGVLDGRRDVDADAVEGFSIESADAPILAHDDQIAVLVLEHRRHFRTKAVRFAERQEPVARDPDQTTRARGEP